MTDLTTEVQPESYIYFSGAINAHSSVNLIEQVSALVRAGRTELQLLINSGGGDVNEAIALYYALRGFPIKITAYNMSVVGSMAVVVFLAADERLAMDNATFFLHETTMHERNDWQLRTAHDLVNGITENEDRIIAIIAERTGNSAEVVEGWLSRTVRFNVNDAKEIGLIADSGELDVLASHEITYVIG